MEPIIIAILSSLTFILLFLFLYSKTQSIKNNTQSLIILQREVESLRSDLRSSLQNIVENLDRQLNFVTRQIQSQTSDVGSRLDNAARIIGDVHRNLGELDKATQEIKELGQNVSKLEELLRAPKLRGSLGELLLEDLLKQVLPSQHFEMQHRFRNGQIVDAIIRTSDGIVPIDSKFPLENFRKMLSVQSDSEKRIFQKAFINDVKKHIDSIAVKYILPDEGTLPFALMYIPAENIYYEVIIKDEDINGTGILSYTIDHKVVPVSPNSFYAYLQVIALGLRGLRIERSAHEILNTLTRLQGEMTRVREAFDVMGAHLDNARKKYEEADKKLTGFESRFFNVSEQTVSPEQENLLP